MLRQQEQEIEEMRHNLQQLEREQQYTTNRENYTERSNSKAGMCASGLALPRTVFYVYVEQLL